MCNKLIPEYREKLDTHSDKRDTARRVVRETTELRSQAQANLQQTNEELAAVNKRIEEGTATRAAEKAEYEANMADHKRAIEGCNEAISLISSLQGGSSFL